MGIDHSNPYIHSTTVLCDMMQQPPPKKASPLNYPCGSSKICSQETQPNIIPNNNLGGAEKNKYLISEVS